MNKSYDVYMCRDSRLRIETERQLDDAELLRSSATYPAYYSPTDYYLHPSKLTDREISDVCERAVKDSFA